MSFCEIYEFEMSRNIYTLSGGGWGESFIELKNGWGVPKSGRRPTCSQRSHNSEDTA